MSSRPAQASEALTHVRTAANNAVQELGAVLAVLREDGDPERSTEPTPGLSSLPALLQTMAISGLEVRYQQTGSARDLPAPPTWRPSASFRSR